MEVQRVINPYRGCRKSILHPKKFIRVDDEYSDHYYLIYVGKKNILYYNSTKETFFLP